MKALKIAGHWSSLALVTVFLVPPISMAQESRITSVIDSTMTVALKGNVNPRALPEFDQGPVDPDFQLSYVTLALKPSAAQQAALEQLLVEQQNPSSPNYRHWLTPEQYADRFGVTVGDMMKIEAWLVSQGFTVNHVARSRNRIAFSGTAAQVAGAFQTQIHRYVVDGETHFSNVPEPSVSLSLEPVVLGILGLDDFRPKSPSGAGAATVMHPRLTANGAHALAPDDIATIYDIGRLYQAGIDGSGQQIAVVGQSDIHLLDIATFRSGILPANVPKTILYGVDPGPTQDEEEADLDLEWVGAVARNATIFYVYSKNVFDAAAYAVDQNLASIISMSFGACELPPPSATAVTALRSWVQQANAQGITVIASSGDRGAAGCDQNNPSATKGFAVQYPASIPEVTGVGGTEFADDTGNYWSSTNSPTGETALSYIPEVAWNETALGAGLSASGGGFSTLYRQPSWQVGPGFQDLGARAVPDVALAAAVRHDPYIIVSGGQPQFVGGTSAATPVFAGLVALLNQYQGTKGLGNINPNLYRLAQTNTFHDITTGNNVVPCVAGSPNCATGSFGYYAGPGYDPVTGLGSVDAYNLVTEWNMPTPASRVTATCTPNPVYEQQPNAQGYSWFYTIVLTEAAGVGTTVTGFTFNGVDYSSQITNYFGTPTLTANGVLSVNLEAKGLSVPSNVVFGFTGVDAGGRQWTKQLSVPFYGPQSSTAPPSPTITAVVNAASFVAGMSPGAAVTIFGKNLSHVTGIASPGGASAYQGVSITIGGQIAPLFLVANVNGQEQINVQVPMGLTPGSTQVQVNNNGAVGIANVSLTTMQPGIFEYFPAGSSVTYAAMFKQDGSVMGPSNPAPRGSEVAMYLTGMGPTSPGVQTDQPGPVPLANTTFVPVVMLNGVSAPVAFSGLAPGFVGLDQVNFLIPSNAPTGSAVQLSVVVNGVSSQTSRIAIQ